MMKKLKGVLLLGSIVLQIFAFTGVLTPRVQAVDGVGTHQITAVYYKAYIHDDHDSDWWLKGAGEWQFTMDRTGWTRLYDRDGPGWVDFRDLRSCWSISGDTWFWCRAVEDDYGEDWDSYSSIRVRVPFPGTRVNCWYYGSERYEDTTHYYKYKIQDCAPTVPSISGPSSGVIGVAYTWQASSSDPEGDSVTFEWSVDGVVQPETDGGRQPPFELSGLRYTFQSPGTYTIRVKAMDYFRLHRGYTSKTITISPLTDAPSWSGP